EQRAVELPRHRNLAHRLRQPPLPHDALHLLVGLEGLKRRLHHPAPSRHGLPRRSPHLEHRRPVHVRPSASSQPSHRAQSNRTSRLPARQHHLVRLLERPENSRRSSHPGRSTTRSNPTLRPRRLHPPSRPTRAIRRRKSKRPHRTPHLHRRQRQLHPLSGRGRQLQLRNRTPRHHSHHMVAIRQHPDHRTAHRNLH